RHPGAPARTPDRSISLRRQRNRPAGRCRSRIADRRAGGKSAWNPPAPGAVGVPPPKPSAPVAPEQKAATSHRRWIARGLRRTAKPCPATIPPCFRGKVDLRRGVLVSAASRQILGRSFFLDCSMQKAATADTAIPAAAAPASAAVKSGLTVLPIIVALSFCHMLNDLMQSMIPALYPLLKSNLELDFTQI